jgi:hypothetical protein
VAPIGPTNRDPLSELGMGESESDKFARPTGDDVGVVDSCAKR